MSLTLEEHKDDNLISVGPFGSKTGRGIWDDGVHSTVRQILIHIDLSDTIRSIQIEYDDNGNSVWSDMHGMDLMHLFGFKPNKVVLDYPGEYLTSIQGYYSSKWLYPSYISQLIVRSNRRNYGPFGLEIPKGKFFSLEARGNMIVGFHGRISVVGLPCALGAYLKPIDDRNESYSNRHPSKAAQRLGVPSPTTVQTKAGGNAKLEGETYIVSSNQVSGNQGDHNGPFFVGRKSNYIYIS